MENYRGISLIGLIYLEVLVRSLHNTQHSSPYTRRSVYSPHTHKASWLFYPQMINSRPFLLSPYHFNI